MMSDTDETDLAYETANSSVSSDVSIESDDSFVMNGVIRHVWINPAVYVGKWTEQDRYDMWSACVYPDIAPGFLGNIEIMFRIRDIVVDIGANFVNRLTMSVLEVSDSGTRDMLQVVDPQGDGDGSLSIWSYNDDVRESISRRFETIEELTVTVRQCHSSSNPTASLIVSLCTTRMDEFGDIEICHCETIFLRGQDFGELLLDALLDYVRPYDGYVDILDTTYLSDFNRNCLTGGYITSCAKKFDLDNVDGPALLLYLDKHDHDRVAYYDEKLESLSSALRSFISDNNLDVEVVVCRGDRD